MSTTEHPSPPSTDSTIDDPQTDSQGSTTPDDASELFGADRELLVDNLRYYLVSLVS